MPQEITRTQIEKYTVYTGPTAESFSPIMAGITYPDPAYEILVYRRPLCVFEYVLSGRGHIERNGSTLTVNAGDAYILLPAPTTTTIQTKLIPGPRSGSMSAAVWYSIFSPITA